MVARRGLVAQSPSSRVDHCRAMPRDAARYRMKIR
jgi:hypothetical protein